MRYPVANVANSSEVASQESTQVLEQLERLNWLDLRLYQ